MDIDNPGSIYVLKDVWIDEDRTPEGKTLLDIRGRLKQDDPDALQHFLDLECHGVVTLDGQKDLTSSIPSRATKSGLNTISLRNFQKQAKKEETTDRSRASLGVGKVARLMRPHRNASLAGEEILVNTTELFSKGSQVLRSTTFQLMKHLWP
jgi:hypothetical protein